MQPAQLFPTPLSNKIHAIYLPQKPDKQMIDWLHASPSAVMNKANYFL